MLTKQRIFLYMDETGAYTEQFLASFKERIEGLRDLLKRDSVDGKHPEPIIKLMTRKLDDVGAYLSSPRNVAD